MARRIGLEHEEGALKADAPACPADAALTKAVEKYRNAAGAEGEPGDAWERELLLRAFAAQTAIDWPRPRESCSRRGRTFSSRGPLLEEAVLLKASSAA